MPMGSFLIWFNPINTSDNWYNNHPWGGPPPILKPSTGLGSNSWRIRPVAVSVVIWSLLHTHTHTMTCGELTQRSYCEHTGWTHSYCWSAGKQPCLVLGHRLYQQTNNWMQGSKSPSRRDSCFDWDRSRGRRLTFQLRKRRHPSQLPCSRLRGRPERRHFDSSWP